MKQLKTRQVCFFLIAFLPITKFFSLPSIMARHAGEDLWISALICILIDFITLIPIVMACKNANKNFFELVKAKNNTEDVSSGLQSVELADYIRKRKTKYTKK